MNTIVVVGGGGHSAVVIALIKSLGIYRILGYTDRCDKGEILGVPYLGEDSVLGYLRSERGCQSAVIGIGYVEIGLSRAHHFQHLKDIGFDLPPLLAPDAVVNGPTTIDEGTVVLSGVVVNSRVHIGRGCIVNTNSTIEHDCVIDDFTHLGPGSIMCGAAHVGKFCFLGAGSCIIQGIRISQGCLIGAGSVVIKDCTDQGVYAGNPARFLKRNDV